MSKRFVDLVISTAAKGDYLIRKFNVDLFGFDEAIIGFYQEPIRKKTFKRTNSDLVEEVARMASPF